MSLLKTNFLTPPPTTLLLLTEGVRHSLSHSTYLKRLYKLEICEICKAMTGQKQLNIKMLSSSLLLRILFTVGSKQIFGYQASVVAIPALNTCWRERQWTGLMPGLLEDILLGTASIRHVEFDQVSNKTHAGYGVLNFSFILNIFLSATYMNNTASAPLWPSFALPPAVISPSQIYYHFFNVIITSIYLYT